MHIILIDRGLNGKGWYYWDSITDIVDMNFKTITVPQMSVRKYALWGSVLSALGDTVQVIGGAISIEESNIADKQQQQALQKLQSQIDDLQKAQSQNNGMGIDVGMLKDLLDANT